MDFFKQAAEKHNELLFTEYHIIVENGTKNYLFTICFSSKEFKHPLGLHKLSDIDLHAWGSKKILDKVLDDEINIDEIYKSKSFADMSNSLKRIYEYPYTTDYLDKVDTLYIWDGKKVGSTIEANILVQVPSSLYINEKNHLFFTEISDVKPVDQIIKFENRIDLSSIKVHKQNGLTLKSQFSSSNDYTLDRVKKQQPKLIPLKILYKEKIEVFYQGKEKVEKNYIRLLCDKHFEIQMQKKGCFFPPQSSNIMQVTYNTTSQGNINLFSSGVAVAQHQRLSLKDAFTSLLNNWAEKIKASVEERRQELRNTKQEITDLKEAIAKRDEQLAEKNNEIANLKEERAKLTDQLEKQKQFVTTTAKPTRSFSQNLDDFAKRVRAENAAKSQAKPNHTHPTDKKR